MDGVVKTLVIHHFSVEISFFSPVVLQWLSQAPQFCFRFLILSHLNENSAA